MNLFGNYEFEYNLIDVATVLRAYEPYASLAAISRASGINQHLLSHYANRMKQPRPQQRQRIVDAFQKLAVNLWLLYSLLFDGNALHSLARA